MTQQPIERIVIKKIEQIQARKEESHLHKYRKKRKLQGERIWEIGRDKMIETGRFSRYGKEGKKSLKYTLIYPTWPWAYVTS